MIGWRNGLTGRRSYSVTDGFTGNPIITELLVRVAHNGLQGDAATHIAPTLLLRRINAPKYPFRTSRALHENMQLIMLDVCLYLTINICLLIWFHDRSMMSIAWGLIYGWLNLRESNCEGCLTWFILWAWTIQGKFAGLFLRKHACWMPVLTNIMGHFFGEVT